MSTQDQCRASRLLPRPELRFGTAALSYDSEADHRNVPEPVICVKHIRAIRRILASTLFVAITSIRLSYVNDPDAQPVCGGDGYIDGHTNKISQANKRFAPAGQHDSVSAITWRVRRRVRRRVRPKLLQLAVESG